MDWVDQNQQRREFAAVHPQAGRADRVDRLRPPPGSLVARIVAAGGTSRIGGHRPDGGLYKTAELPVGTPAGLLSDLEREGWHIVRVASTDPTAWVGEAEDELPPLQGYGDETEHDAWLAGTPAAELWPAS